MDPRASIIEAAARLLAEEGTRALTTRGVAEAAGVQAPTIYRLFGDKDGLIDAVAEHVMATYVTAKADTIDAGDPVAALDAGWRLHIDFGLANSELYALLNTRRQSPATTAGIEVLRARVRRLATAGLLQVSEQRALEMIHAAGSGTLLALIATPPEQRDAGLPDAMLAAVKSVILADAPAPPPAGPLAIAISFASVIAELPALSDAERALLSEWVARAIAQHELPMGETVRS